MPKRDGYAVVVRPAACGERQGIDDSAADAVVIAAGHNGPVGANLPSDAGWSVVVCGATSHMGGVVPEADGRPGTAAWRCRLTAVVCGRTAIGHQIGYGTGDMRGPWPLSVVFTHRRQRCQEIAWSDVAHFDRPRITLSTRSRQQSGSKR